MIQLTFNRVGMMETSHIPAEWRQNISQEPTATSTIYKVIISVEVEDTSYRYRSLMQRPQLVLKFSLPYFVEFPVGTSCTFQNQTFTLNNPENIKKQGTRNIEYSMTLGTKEDNLANYKFRNSVDGRLKWSMCARPHEFIEEICKTLNERDGEGVWFCNKDHIIEATEKTIEFNHVYCDSALSSVAETFETEHEIIDHNNGTFEIALHKVEYFKSQPLPLSYGRGNGFVPGVGRTTESEGQPIKRLYCQGGERNIDRSKYGSQFGYSNNPKELRLPKSQTLEYEGRTYITDAQGYYIERSDKASQAVKEDSLDCSEIYPSYIGKVTGVTNPNPEKNFFDIVDSNIPDNLNFNNYLIAGENMTIIFQSGMLAGREFEVKYIHEDKRWELVPMEEDGITFPNETFKPTVNNTTPDTYAVFGIMLPNEYICDNQSKTGASWDMFKEGARYLYEHEDQKFTFSGVLQGLYAKQNWLQIGGYIKVGAYIHFTDNQFAVDGLDIRIIGVKDYVNNPYAPTLEISNSIQSPATVSSELKNIDNYEVYTDEAKRQLIAFTKRRFRDAKETAAMLAQAALDNFTDGITPITVQTMSALVGDESLQFEFIQRSHFPDPDTGESTLVETKVANPVIYSNTTHKLSTTYSLYLRHLTFGIKTISSKSPDKSEYKTWYMTQYTSPVLSGEDMASKGFFLYAKCAKEDFNDGTFILSEKSIAMDSVNGYWHFLVGVLTSMQDGERSYTNLYGFTEILPGRITTDRVVSADGGSYFDLANNSFKLGNNLAFNINGSKTLRLRGAMVQSSSGDVSPLPCYRGVYSDTTYYFKGDLVTFTSLGSTSTYICTTTNENGVVNVSPLLSNSPWKIYARGSNGTNGNDGNDGNDAPIMVFRGNYNTAKTYYGNPLRVDCVRFGNTYYISKTTAPNGTAGFSGVEPGNNNTWQSFGASFESIATGLLLAENANIANLIFRNQRLESTAQTNNEPNIIIDGITGNVKFGWLRTIGRELLGFDNDGTQRLRFTPLELPAVNSSSTSKNLIVKSTGGDATFTGGTTTEVSFEQSVHCYFGREDQADDIEMDFYGWVEFDIAENNTLINLSDIQFNCSVKPMTSNETQYLSCTLSATVQRQNGTSWENIGSVSLGSGSSKITIPKAGRIRITFNGTVNDLIIYNCSGTFSISAQAIQATTAKTEMIIAKDGFMAIYNSNYMRFHSTDGLIVKIGNNHLRINNSGIAKSSNGSTWTNL